MTIAALVASGALRMNATGPAVTAVQLALRNAGHGLQPDGVVDVPNWRSHAIR